MIKGYLNGDIADQRRWHRNQSCRSICRLDFGQNNDGCAPAVAEAVAAGLASRGPGAMFHAYPPFGTCALHEMLAHRHAVPTDAILLTAGIEQAIANIANGLLSPGDPVVVFEPSFFLFSRFSARAGARPVAVRLDESAGFALDDAALARLGRALATTRPRVVWLANPNNPTGQAVPATHLEAIVRMTADCRAVLVIDEAYGEYTDPDGGLDSASRFLSDASHVIVLRTFSKAFGLAGLRIGYAIARDPSIRAALEGHGVNFPVTRLSMDAAMAALRHSDHLAAVRRRTGRRLGALSARFREMPAVRALPSDCCIYLLRHRGMAAECLRRALEAQGVVTAGVPGQGCAGAGYIRITVGDLEANRRLLAALDRISSDVEGRWDGSAG